MSGRASGLVGCTLALLVLAGCQRQPTDDQIAKLDNQITGKEADPALTSALQDPILTDPALTQQSNKNAVRPAEGPVQAQYPTGTGRPRARRVAAAPAKPERSAGHRAMRRLAQGEGTGCGVPIQQDMAWARRMPASFPVLPGGRVTDAGGIDVGECRFRVVTFTSDAPPARVLDWYQRRAAGAGYSAERERRENEYVLAGASERDGGAYYLIVTPLGRGGSDVALIANNGA